MKPQNEVQKLIEIQKQASNPRIKIEKLEERIAPAKGGIPGPPSGYEPPGQNYCFTHRRDRAC